MRDVEVREVADFGDLCGESPVWDPSTSTLYWTDCGGLRFHRYHPGSRHAETVRSGIEINGFRLNRPGGFVVTNNRGLWLWDGISEGMTVVASELSSRPCRLNDCVADPRGRVLAGSWFYDPASEYPLGQLISCNTGGALAVLDDGFHLANGLAFSPDGSLLYATDSAARRIYRYEYDLENGTVSNRHTLIEVPAEEGLPDGLRVDTEGYLWSAQWYGSCIVRYDPDGVAERRLSIPAKQTSCLTFGGPNLETLYVTSAKQSEPMPVMPPGYDPEHGFFGGPLYEVNVGIQGLPDLCANIRIIKSEQES